MNFDEGVTENERLLAPVLQEIMDEFFEHEMIFTVGDELIIVYPVGTYVIASRAT